MIPLQNDTQALKFMFPTTENDWAIMPEKSKKQNKFATFNFIIYCPSTIIALQKATQALNLHFQLLKMTKPKIPKKRIEQFVRIIY